MIFALPTYIKSRFSAEGWIEHETCFWTECTTVHNVHLSAVSNIFFFMGNLAFRYARGCEFATLSCGFKQCQQKLLPEEDDQTPNHIGKESDPSPIVTPVGLHIHCREMGLTL